MNMGSISRRRALSLLGCSAAAFPLATPMSFASVPSDNRLVVIILRGGLDGLDALRPFGDPDLARLRPRFETAPGDGSPDLTGFHALHPSLAPLMPLWRQGQLGFVQAVSTPYRGKRSHFDGQDILEAGTAGDVPDMARRDGWLNRLLPLMPGAHGRTAFAIGRSEMLILRGSADHASWAPEA
ncbi:MAG: twin-arginine translocation pathway signal, partial [Pseudomonadota bacterium]